MRESILSALSAFLKADNFPGKRQYIAKLDGLHQLKAWICFTPEDEEIYLGKGSESRKIRIKTMQLVYDMLLNDDGIINNGRSVRTRLGGDLEFISKLLSTL